MRASASGEREVCGVSWTPLCHQGVTEVTEGLREGCERWKRSQWGGGVGRGSRGRKRGINLHHLKLLMGVGREDHGHNLKGS